MSAISHEVGADAYCCVAETTTRSLLWTFARAIERAQLIREHRRLVQMEQQRLAHEHQEAERLLAEQRALIADLEKIRTAETAGPLVKGEVTAEANVDCGLQLAGSIDSQAAIGGKPISPICPSASSPITAKCCGHTS